MTTRRGLAAPTDVGLRLYVDVSGKEHEHPVVTAAGYLATRDEWSAFERTWRAILTDCRVSAFHATDFFNGGREFRHLDPQSDAHRQFAMRFARACYKLLPNGFAYSIDVPAFTAQMADVVRRVKTPTAKLGPATWAVSALCNRVAQQALPPGSPKAEMWLESGDGTGEALAYLQSLVRLGEQWTAAFTAFSATPKATIGAQAADFLAYESRQEVLRSLGAPDRTWEDIHRDTFKILATGPEMQKPGEGVPKVDMQYASEKHFPEWERGITQFLDEHARYRRPAPRPAKGPRP